MNLGVIAKILYIPKDPVLRHEVTSPDTLEKRGRYSMIKRPYWFRCECKKKGVIKASPYAECYSLSSLFLTSSTVASPSYPGHSLAMGFYSSAEVHFTYSTAPADKAGQGSSTLHSPELQNCSLTTRYRSVSYTTNPFEDGGLRLLQGIKLAYSRDHH